jgi:hypothetical protein
VAFEKLQVFNDLCFGLLDFVVVGDKAAGALQPGLANGRRR